MKNIFILLSGTIFSFGLVISGMTNPDKVIGFLDIFGDWDYSLAFVMGGAVCFNLLSFWPILKEKPLFSEEFHLPLKKAIDKKLVAGSALFGIGWGLVGICPGPAIVNLVMFSGSSVLFVISMLVGMFLFKKFLE